VAQVGGRYWPEGPLVDVAWLRRHLGVEQVAILDCRCDLFDPAAAERAYRDGHIPGAVYMHLERDLSGPKGEHGGRHPLPSPAAFEAAMGAAGVGPETMVVAYDADASAAPRAWWLLRHMGHDAVAVLDGGIGAWIAAGGPLEQAVPSPVPRPFTARPRRGWVVDAAQVRGRAPGDVLLDARAGERYRGEVEPIDPRAGHIPGARSAPYRDNLAPDGTWLDGQTLAARYDRLLGPDGRAIAYCGSGVTACAVLLALELAGRRGGLLYAGSFSDWVSYPEAPVVTGEEP
jgi:thiosulfate/3-mercaptopyruvate sulfurtransferase